MNNKVTHLLLYHLVWCDDLDVILVDIHKVSGKDHLSTFDVVDFSRGDGHKITFGANIVGYVVA